MFSIRYFYSPTCKICDHQKIILSDLERDNAVPIENYNIFTDLDKALSHGINSSPAMAILFEGRTVEVLTGFQERRVIEEKLAHWREMAG
jgi:thioredoxin-like negative regulator of GroEL